MKKLEGNFLLEEIEKFLSYEQYILLLKEFSGLRKYIPHKMRYNNDFARVFGLDFATHLSQEFGGNYIDVPCKMLHARDRKQLIIHLRKKGTRICDIARRVSCSERRVFQILSNHKHQMHTIQNLRGI